MGILGNVRSYPLMLKQMTRAERERERKLLQQKINYNTSLIGTEEDLLDTLLVSQLINILKLTLPKNT